ncbi:MAG TPA: hypothetical protein VII55_01665 [Candidatus Saccharimonadales bacterium]
MSDEPSAVDRQEVIGDQLPAQTQADEEQQQAAHDYDQSHHKDRLSMNVRVYSPFRDYYDGPAFSLTAENATGPFDILPKHHNFISLLDPCDLIVRTIREGEQKIRISGGLMHVKADEIIVFLDI